MGLDMYLSRRKYTPSDDVGYWRKANAIHQWFVDNVQDGEDDCKEYEVSRDQLEALLGLVNQVLESTKLVIGEVVASETYKDGKWIPNMAPGKVLDDDGVARELLPTQSGFFFGNTDYDDWYWEKLQDTKRIIKEALESGDDFSFYYQSSW